MTDKLAALGALVGKDPATCPERAEALKTFYDDAAGDFLVVNKWFGIQKSRFGLRSSCFAYISMLL